MKRNSLFIVVGLCLLLVRPAFAQLPSGPFTYNFTNAPLWDLSGVYTNNTVTNDVVTYTIDCAANGRITGTRVENYVNGADTATATGPIVGKASTRAGQLQASLVSVGEESGVQDDVDYRAHVTARVTSTVDATTLTVFTEGTIRVCAVGGRCITDDQDYSAPLPDGMTGDWTLDTDIVPTGRGLTGTATITLSNGRQLAYQIIGTYASGSQIARLHLVGVGEALGTRLSLTTRGSEMTLTRLQATVLGQKLNVR
jgi:hypothetical protein